ncbi:hypothetical protein JQ629_06630 [Bradyrhizobium sp. AUGA SZCCT0222]|uniref:hypothetical protein n=1 Tax=Bradyrhizobium sp. AUGA SZCCT0222 TaxID=2807668 RepID=UPI001BAB65C5|nr:hypothetical protein [Bradyrhizobium sp. AUGA SZCCT0222]MBR1267181.1 hypothetical protein [Bradyrhizobium sp. AUGA SZCCT0222]
MQQRQHDTPPEILEQCLAEEAHCLREQAKLLPPGAVREATIRKARQAETGSHLSDWLRSPGLKVPN